MYFKEIGNFIFQKSAWKFFLLLTTAIVLVQCSDSEPTSPGDKPNHEEPLSLADIRQEIALQVSNHNILPAYDELENNAVALSNVIDEFSNDPTEASLATSRGELKKLWISWQNAALFQFGPTETNALRLAINTYPTDTDKIEANIQSGAWQLETIDNRDAVGLPAIDYLLNNNLDEETNNLEMLIYDPQRMAYLKALANEISVRIAQVAKEWKQATYLNSFTATTASGTDVGSALGQLVNSIDLHFQQFLRDGKVAIPAGVRSAGVPRARAVEALYGGYSRDLLTASISAYIHLFEGIGLDGTEGTSILDYLDAIDQSMIGTDILNSLQSNLSKAQALNQNLSLQIEQDIDLMIDLFIDLQNTITIIKSDMSSVMGITITNQDNDGD